MYKTWKFDALETHGLPITEFELDRVMEKIGSLPWPDEFREPWFCCVWYNVVDGLDADKCYTSFWSDWCVPCGVFEFQIGPQELLDRVAESVTYCARAGDLDDFVDTEWGPDTDRTGIDAVLAFIRKAKDTDEAV